jgi:dTDP-4-dehydrorhamnose 3,5-epimerase
VIFRETELAGAFEIELEPYRDERGFFARGFCRREFEAYGLVGEWVQSSLSYNVKRGTLRGMHWQVGPHGEAKLVRCTAGAIYDVIVDLRPGSPTCGRWVASELSAANRRACYVPPEFAHGFLTLADATEVFYEISEYHEPKAARGFRWNDPVTAIRWPEEPRVISERDACHPDLPEDLTGVVQS